ncbi:MAG: L,D-transpeptidase [Opitutaceae bacterium]
MLRVALLSFFAGALLTLGARGALPATEVPQEPPLPAVAAALVSEITVFPRPPITWLEVQVELSRRGFSGGPIDGIRGPQSSAALRAFQRSQQIPETGELDERTARVLEMEAPALAWASLAADDLAGLQPLATTWLGKSRQSALAHETALELATERFRAGAGFLRRMNPGLDWDAMTPETLFVAPAAEFVAKPGRAAYVEIRLAEKVLEAFSPDGRLLAHFPTSIARRVEKRPVGDLKVVVVVANPDYTFDPAVFPESEEAKELGRKLILPPGPNNPVGVAWVGLDRPGYGIHGTPDPAKVGHTESHGCFRLANWDAQSLLGLAWIGMTVRVVP